MNGSCDENTVPLKRPDENIGMILPTKSSDIFYSSLKM